MKYSITDMSLEELNAAIAALNKRLDDSIAAAPHDPDERDSANMPWDARIHSASRMKNQTDGTWRARRGVDPEVVKQVTAELLGLPYEPQSEAPQPPPVVEAPPPPPPPPPPLTGRDLLAQLRDVPPAQYLPIIRGHGVQNLTAILNAPPEIIAKIAEALK